MSSAFAPYFSAAVLNAFTQFNAGTAFNTAIIASISSQQAIASGLITQTSGYATSGNPSVSGMVDAMISYNAELSLVSSHDSDLFTSMNVYLGVFCMWSAIQVATSAFASGQVTVQTSGWFGSISASGTYNILASGLVQLLIVSGAVSGGVSGLAAIASGVTASLTAITAVATGMVAQENVNIAAGQSLITIFSSGAGIVGDWSNPGGQAVIRAIGTSGLINGMPT